MRICFSEDKNYVVFLHEDLDEYRALDKFPAFIKKGGFYVSPAILPVAFSIVARIQAKFKVKVRLDTNVADWLQQDFTLLTLPTDFAFHTSPKDFQEIALRYMYTLGSSGLLLDPGMGKSKVVCDYIWLKRFKRSLVVCPVPLLFVWEDEFRKHRPELSFHVVQSTDWDAEVAAGMLTKDVIVINYTKTVMMKHRLKYAEIDFIHLDEYLIKDISTDRTKALLEIGSAIPYRAGGSGTLINNTPLDMYCPIRFVQPALVGTNYGHFRDSYTVQVPARNPDGSPSDRKQIVGFKGVKEMKSILESASIVMNKESWLKLPEKIFTDIQVQMSDPQKKAYYELHRNLYTRLTEDVEVEVENPLVRVAKLYQISNGFVYLYPETEEEAMSDLMCLEPKKKIKRKVSDRSTYFFEQSPKADALRKLITEKLSGRKVMIWFNLGAELVQIERILVELGSKYLTIQGGDKKIGEKVRAFNSDPSISFLVCQSKAVNYGITVLGTKKRDLEDAGVEIFPGVDTQVFTQIFFSLTYSLEVYLQMQDRIHRLGQDKVCEYYRLIGNSPIEKRIRDVLDDKLYLKESMLVDVSKTLLAESVEDVIQ